jgi:hypothetical protein
MVARLSSVRSHGKLFARHSAFLDRPHAAVGQRNTILFPQLEQDCVAFVAYEAKQIDVRLRVHYQGAAHTNTGQHG